MLHQAPKKKKKKSHRAFHISRLHSISQWDVEKEEFRNDPDCWWWLWDPLGNSVSYISALHISVQPVAAAASLSAPALCVNHFTPQLVYVYPLLIRLVISLLSSRPPLCQGDLGLMASHSLKGQQLCVAVSYPPSPIQAEAKIHAFLSFGVELVTQKVRINDPNIFSPPVKICPMALIHYFLICINFSPGLLWPLPVSLLVSDHPSCNSGPHLREQRLCCSWRSI